MSWTRIVAVTERPIEGRSPGAVVEGSYSVEGGKVLVRNERDKLIGSKLLPEGDNAQVIALRILREGRKRSDFYRPLPIQRVPY
jgi:hypothetical protein